MELLTKSGEGVAINIDGMICLGVCIRKALLGGSWDWEVYPCRLDCLRGWMIPVGTVVLPSGEVVRPSRGTVSKRSYAIQWIMKWFRDRNLLNRGEPGGLALVRPTGNLSDPEPDE